MKKLFLRDGKLWYNEFPADVTPEPMRAGGKIAARSQKEVDDYNAAVSAAKASAVEVTKPDQNIQLAFALALGSLMKEGQLYGLPKGWTVEISSCHSFTEGFYRSAHLIPLKEQSSGIAEEINLPEYVDTYAGRMYLGGDPLGIEKTVKAWIENERLGKPPVTGREKAWRLKRSGVISEESVSPPPQESQEDSWAEVFVAISKRGLEQGIKESKEKFTITRKAKP